MSIALLILMTTGAFAALETEQVHAAKKYKLPKKVISYYYEDGKWQKLDGYKCTYDKKGNITKYNYVKYKNIYNKGKLYKTCKTNGYKSTM